MAGKKNLQKPAVLFVGLTGKGTICSQFRFRNKFLACWLVKLHVAKISQRAQLEIQVFRNICSHALMFPFKYPEKLVNFWLIAYCLPGGEIHAGGMYFLATKVSKIPPGEIR